MKTRIYKSYAHFLKRKNKEDNGVSPEFAAQNPNFKQDNLSNKGCYDCSDCTDCHGCSGCHGCSDCSDCSGCYDCSGCHGCYDCSHCSGIQINFAIPEIINIHTTVLNAASNCEALDMGDWHTCDTTHCRAGWVVVLAGEKGLKLEKQTSTLFAAMQIYKKSSEIKVFTRRFFESNEEAMVDMKRCAKEEMESKS